jgi:hypothetical protein
VQELLKRNYLILRRSFCFNFSNPVIIDINNKKPYIESSTGMVKILFPIKACSEYATIGSSVKAPVKTPLTNKKGIKTTIYDR